MRGKDHSQVSICLRRGAAMYRRHECRRMYEAFACLLTACLILHLEGLRTGAIWWMVAAVRQHERFVRLRDCLLVGTMLSGASLDPQHALSQ